MFLNIVYLICIIVLVFVVCSLIELLRQKLFAVIEKRINDGKNNQSVLKEVKTEEE